jgi:plastocyanin
MKCPGGIIRIFATVALFSATLAGESIDGAILITRKLTRRNVTPTVAAYQRGAYAELGHDEDQDPLNYERSHVVIWIEGQADAHRSTPVPAPSLEQMGRRFVPDLLAIPAGTAISFPNLDPIFHNVFSLSKSKSFDLGNYSKGDTRKVVFSRPGIVYVGCHLHPNMAAVIVVTPGDCTKAGPDGRFSLDGVAPGAWTVVAWHRAAGYYRKKVEVLPNRGAHVEFLIPVGVESPGLETSEGN